MCKTVDYISFNDSLGELQNDGNDHSWVLYKLLSNCNRDTNNNV